MKVLVTFPIEIYEQFLGKCSVLSREYLILKNGVVRRDQQENFDRSRVEILCEPERAKFLLDLATLVYPAAAPHIEKSIDLARKQ